MLFNRPAIQFRQFGGRPKRAIARRDRIARERRLIGSRFRSSVIRKPRAFALTHWSFLCVHFHDLIQQRGTMSDISIPGGRIRSFVERIEHLDTELQELNESKKEVFSEAKGEGFDVKILKEIIKLRKQDKDERDTLACTKNLKSDHSGDEVVCRGKAQFLRGCEPLPARVAPAGSNRSRR